MEIVDLRSIAENLEPGPDGIWVARSQYHSISYPEEGNANCLALEAGSFWFEHRSRCIQAALEIFPPPGFILDIGGGNGYVSFGLQQAGFQVALVEPGRQGVENARRRGVKVLVASTLEDARFRAGAVPAVGLFDVLEHVQQDESFLRTMRDLLAPGGRLYLTTPAYPFLWSADDDYAGHYRRYSLPFLRKRLERSGLRVEFASYCFFMLPLPIFLLRAVPSRLGLRRQEDWARYQAEHQTRPGMIGRALDFLLGWELGLLRKGRALPLGASCLVVATRATSSVAR